jgi:hypothetical protein
MVTCTAVLRLLKKESDVGPYPVYWLMACAFASNSTEMPNSDSFSVLLPLNACINLISINEK